MTASIPRRLIPVLLGAGASIAAPPALSWPDDASTAPVTQSSTASAMPPSTPVDSADALASEVRGGETTPVSGAPQEPPKEGWATQHRAADELRSVGIQLRLDGGPFLERHVGFMMAGVPDHRSSAAGYR